MIVNAVDDPPNATAFFGGIIRRGDVTVALSSGGRAPGLTALLRQAVDALLPPDIDAWVDAAADARVAWRRQGVPMEQRRHLLLETLNRLDDGGSERTRPTERAVGAPERTGQAEPSVGRVVLDPASEAPV